MFENKRHESAYITLRNFHSKKRSDEITNRLEEILIIFMDRETLFDVGEMEEMRTEFEELQHELKFYIKVNKRFKDKTAQEYAPVILLKNRFRSRY